MRLIEITLNTTPNVPTTYTYKLKVTNYSGNSVYIHYGRFFATGSQTKVTLDLDDVLWNYRYKGSQTLEPVLSVADNQYVMPTAGTFSVLNDCWYNTVQVEDTEVTPRFSSNAYNFFFLPIQIAGYKGITLPNAGCYIPVLDSVLMPHIPNNPPAGFHWSVMLYCVSNRTVRINKDNQGLAYLPVTAGKAYAASLTGATNTYSISTDNGSTFTPVTVIDQCNKPYYLIWQANNGALQCQGFNKSSEFGIKYQTNTRVDIHGNEWNVSSTDTATWKLKSNNLNDAEYKAYGEMFNSPYLILLDMENSRLHYCITKSTDYKEKRRTRNNTKPKFFEIEVSASEHLKV